jgi:hypothetical protein
MMSSTLDGRTKLLGSEMGENTQTVDSNGRGGGIRTPDPLLPKQMRYQATLRPDSRIVSQPASSGLVAEPLQEPENEKDRGQKDGGQGDRNQR